MTGLTIFSQRLRLTQYDATCYHLDLEIERIGLEDAALVFCLALKHYQFSHGWLSVTLPRNVNATSPIRVMNIRPINTTTIDWQQVRGWVQKCDAEHFQYCGGEETDDVGIAGFQVIDCETRNLVPAPARCTYAALSYVWGSVSGTSEVFLPQLSQAPLTIEDAIICTEKLGIRYLWVDRYCIDQDDPETKHGLIQRMDQIYQNASITIINAAGEGPECGLPGVSSTSRRPQSSATLRGVTFTTVPNVKVELARSAWFSRGWTYQEGLLSRRRLIFTPSQVSFQCLKTCTCEAIPVHIKVPQDYGNSAYDAGKISDMMQGLPGPLEVRGSHMITKEEHASPMFRRVYLGMRINEYLKKTLSHESDILNAFIGVLRYAWLLSDPIYNFWGLPFRSLMSDADFLGALFWVS
jgi:hypothetical protein